MKVLFFAVLCGVLMWAEAYAPTHLGVCPPADEYGHSCHKPCESDIDCGDGRFCCQVRCGKTCMERFQPKESPRCPKPDFQLVCIVFFHQCNNDDQCRHHDRQQFCCLKPNCGRSCTEGVYLKD